MLLDGSWSVVEDTSTDSDGILRWRGLQPATYRLRWGRLASLPTTLAR
jgi:hypothetical protein